MSRVQRATGDFVFMVDDWKDAPLLINKLKKDPDDLAARQRELVAFWSLWKDSLSLRAKCGFCQRVSPDACMTFQQPAALPPFNTSDKANMLPLFNASLRPRFGLNLLHFSNSVVEQVLDKRFTSSIGTDGWSGVSPVQRVVSKDLKESQLEGKRRGGGGGQPLQSKESRNEKSDCLFKLGCTRHAVDEEVFE